MGALDKLATIDAQLAELRKQMAEIQQANEGRYEMRPKDAEQHAELRQQHNRLVADRNAMADRVLSEDGGVQQAIAREAKIRERCVRAERTLRELNNELTRLRQQRQTAYLDGEDISGLTSRIVAAEHDRAFFGEICEQANSIATTSYNESQNARAAVRRKYGFPA